VDLSARGRSSSPSVLTAQSVADDVWWQASGAAFGDTGKLQCFCQGALAQRGMKVRPRLRIGA
jgi:hypothetical protein